MPDSSPIVTGADYLKLPRSPQTWLIEDMLPVGGGLLLFGDAKVGKSYAALQLACCLTSGVDWLGFHIPAPRKVVYVQLDTPRTLWADRVQALADSGHPVEGVHQADRETLNTHPFDILRPEHYMLLQENLAKVEAGAVIIDTLREFHSNDENDSTEMQEVIAHLDACVKPAAMILVSHARKANPDRGYDLMNDNRGSNYIVGRMDAICRFSKSSMRVSGRTMEEHSIKLQRNEDMTWSLAQDPFLAMMEITVQNSHGKSVRELAEILKLRTEAEGPAKSFEACRSALTRYLKEKSRLVQR